MTSAILIVTFIFCLAMAAAGCLVGYQLVNTYNTDLHKRFFYYLVAFYAFAFYGIWGQVLTRALLASFDTEAAVIEIVAGFLPVLGVPFLFVSWIMLVTMGLAIAGRPLRPAWTLLHVTAFVLLLAASWLAVTVLRAPRDFLDANLLVIEAAGMTAVELLYFAVFLLLVLRVPARDARGGKVLRTFSLLLCGSFVARVLLGALVLLDVRLAAPALVAYFGSNLAPLLYLRTKSDEAFKPVKAETANTEGMTHVFDRYGITKRERQIVQKVCLGKTNQQVADELFISLQTVKDHTHRIYSKLGVKSRMQLVQLMDKAK
ncbi:MAG TPA: LuxR C-terminal-related transcriptional regulator [Gammaproteobacteria bacterium]